MKLLFFFTQQIAPNAGGVERIVTCMYEELSKRGFDITTLYLKPFQSEKAIPNQIQLPSIDGSTFENEEYIKNILKTNYFNIAFNFGAIFNRSSDAFMKACYSENLPIISVYHNTLDWILWLNKYSMRLMRNKISREIVRKIYSIYQKFPFINNARYYSKKSAASVVLASCYKQEYLKLIDSSPHHLTAIYNPQAMSVASEKISWTDKLNEVLFVGRLEEQKNVAELIRIWSSINPQGWKLNIIGDGSQQSMLETLIDDLDLNDSVVLFGHQDNPQEFYSRAKIFVMTSKYEGFPMTLIECQSFGCVPIIYDSYPAAKEIVENGVNGFLIPFRQKRVFADRLIRLISDKILLQNLSSNSIRKAERFKPDIIMDEWVNLISQHSR
ncbi:glycosyltransferase [uncultured Duncaniella sp.]|uniref:glycosyltransferase n=1 Tax=uncultured Duncaniella sp. TaxID=2768039 RepID=UPI0025AA312C|nr:glycosyltransferase [uncultured Duncaniella sp.]